MLKSKFASQAGAVLLAATALAGCTRQTQTEVGVKSTGWGQSIEVSTNPGLKCFFPCAPGNSWRFISTGEHPIHIVASLPSQIPQSKGDDSSSFGVVKTSEGLPLQGAVTIWVQIKDAGSHPKDIENLYRKFPPRADENDQEYLDRLLTRLAAHSFDSVQAVYKNVPVDQFGTSGPQVSAEIKRRVEANFAEQGFGVIKVGSVVLSGINLGPAAEQANQQIGLADVSKKVAIAQQGAAEEQTKAQAALAPMADDLAKRLNSTDMCLYYYKNDEVFAKRYGHSCFPSVEMK